MLDLLSEHFTKLLFTFTLTLIVSLAISKWLRERNYPPGPFGLPVVGYGLFLGAKPNEKLRDLGKKYGDVFSFYLGSTLHIIVNDFRLAKEALTNPLALARPESAFAFMTGSGGFGGMSGEGWQEQRRFAFYTMRNLGLGKGPWETMIQESVGDFIEEIKNWQGKASNFESALSYSQARNGISLLVGRHLDKVKDAENIEIIRTSTRELMKYFSAVSATVSFPGLSKFLSFFGLAGYNKFFILLEKYEDIFKKEVEERMKDPESLMKDDFIGCFLREKEKKEMEPKNHYFTMDILIGNMVLLFIAGNDSTLASVSWLFLLMAEHPDIQDKILEEIDSVIGRDGVPSFDDRRKFPYTVATILETMRWAAVAPIFPPRYVSEDFTLNGYTIPRGSNILCNAWAVMRDPRYFENPEKFRPERFLTQNGDKIVQLEGYLAFSLGKRNCPGEGVANMTTFLYFVLIMQRFKVKVPPGSKIDLEPVFGGALLPKPQNLCFEER